jgi:hypothetical protein
VSNLRTVLEFDFCYIEVPVGSLFKGGNMSEEDRMFEDLSKMLDDIDKPSGLYAILVDEKIVPVGVRIWSVWFGQDPDTNGRRIALTEYTKFDKPSRLSTAFLGLDHGHGPNEHLWFETCFFYGDDKYTAYTRVLERYETIEEAKEGHQHWKDQIDLIEDLSGIIKPELGAGE